MTDPVFVFGSNLAGRHGKGAALWALQHRGAIYGQGFGRQGNAYGIPTKSEKLETLPLDSIAYYVRLFLDIARATPATSYQLTPIGTGLAGYDAADIAPMFADAPPNVLMPPEFEAILHPPVPDP